jgi:hypothetical protein
MRFHAWALFAVAVLFEGCGKETGTEGEEANDVESREHAAEQRRKRLEKRKKKQKSGRKAQAQAQNHQPILTPLQANDELDVAQDTKTAMKAPILIQPVVIVDHAADGKAKAAALEHRIKVESAACMADTSAVSFEGKLKKFEMSFGQDLIVLRETLRHSSSLEAIVKPIVQQLGMTVVDLKLNADKLKRNTKGVDKSKESLEEILSARRVMLEQYIGNDVLRKKIQGHFAEQFAIAAKSGTPLMTQADIGILLDHLKREFAIDASDEAMTKAFDEMKPHPETAAFEAWLEREIVPSAETVKTKLKKLDRKRKEAQFQAAGVPEAIRSMVPGKVKLAPEDIAGLCDDGEVRDFIKLIWPIDVFKAKVEGELKKDTLPPVAVSVATIARWRTDYYVGQSESVMNDADAWLLAELMGNARVNTALLADPKPLKDLEAPNVQKHFADTYFTSFTKTKLDVLKNVYARLPRPSDVELQAAVQTYVNEVEAERQALNRLFGNGHLALLTIWLAETKVLAANEGGIDAIKEILKRNRLPINSNSAENLDEGLKRRKTFIDEWKRLVGDDGSEAKTIVVSELNEAKILEKIDEYWNTLSTESKDFLLDVGKDVLAPPSVVFARMLPERNLGISDLETKLSGKEADWHLDEHKGRINDFVRSLIAVRTRLIGVRTAKMAEWEAELNKGMAVQLSTILVPEDWRMIDITAWSGDEQALMNLVPGVSEFGQFRAAITTEGQNLAAGSTSGQAFLGEVARVKQALLDRVKGTGLEAVVSGERLRYLLKNIIDQLGIAVHVAKALIEIMIGKVSALGFATSSEITELETRVRELIALLKEKIDEFPTIKGDVETAVRNSKPLLDQIDTVWSSLSGEEQTILTGKVWERLVPPTEWLTKWSNEKRDRDWAGGKVDGDTPDVTHLVRAIKDTKAEIDNIIGSCERADAEAKWSTKLVKEAERLFAGVVKPIKWANLDLTTAGLDADEQALVKDIEIVTNFATFRAAVGPLVVVAGNAIGVAGDENARKAAITTLNSEIAGLLGPITAGDQPLYIGIADAAITAVVAVADEKKKWHAVDEFEKIAPAGIDPKKIITNVIQVVHSISKADVQTRAKELIKDKCQASVDLVSRIDTAWGGLDAAQQTWLKGVWADLEPPTVKMAEYIRTEKVTWTAQISGGDIAALKVVLDQLHTKRTEIVVASAPRPVGDVTNHLNGLIGQVLDEVVPVDKWFLDEGLTGDEQDIVSQSKARDILSKLKAGVQDWIQQVADERNQREKFTKLGGFAGLLLKRFTDIDVLADKPASLTVDALGNFVKNTLTAAQKTLIRDTVGGGGDFTADDVARKALLNKLIA